MDRIRVRPRRIEGVSQEARNVQDAGRGVGEGRGVPESGAVRFGAFELDFATGELRKTGLLVHLQQQPFKVLALLASRAGQLVTREEIQREIWRSDTYVDFDQGLNFCIKQIRSALGDQAETPRFVETLPRRGYRFLAPVTPVLAVAHSSEPSGAPTSPSAPGPDRRRAWLVPALAFVAIAAASGLWALRRPAPVPVTWHRLTFRRGNVVSARFAPGGEVLYSAAWGGEPSALYAGLVGTPDARRMPLPTTARIVAVSPQSETAYLDSPSAMLPGTLFRSPVSGAPGKAILSGVFSADWSRDGSTFAVARDTDAGMVVEYPVGHRIARATNPSFLRISPDGAHLSFIDYLALNDDRGSVVILDRDGKTVARGSAWGSLEGLAWSARGDEVYFTAARSGIDSELQALDLRGRERRLLPTSGRLVIHDVAPDGRLLLERGSLRQEARFGRDGEPEQDLSWFDATSVTALSPDAKTALLVESGEAGGSDYVAYLRPTDGSPAVRLGPGQAVDISADGRTVLAIPVAKADHLDLLPVGAGETRAIQFDGISHYTWAGFFPAGDRVFFVGHGEGQPSRLWQGDLGGGKARPIGPEGMGPNRNLLSPDGRLAAMSCADESDATCLFPTGEGDPKPIPGSEGASPLGWDASGKGLFVRQRGRALPARVSRIDVATGRKVLVREVSPPDTVGVNAVQVVTARDGKAYAYWYTRRLSELYVVEGVR
jgi:eukaryotic-like serine/threonine-protein kinase